MEVSVLSVSLTSVWSLPFCFFSSPLLGCFLFMKFGRVSFKKRGLIILKSPENCVFASSHLILINTVLRVP